MKKILVLIICWFFSAAVYSQDLKDKSVQIPTTKEKAMYCASLIDGKMVLLSDGKVVTADVKFPNGTKIKRDFAEWDVPRLDKHIRESWYKAQADGFRVWQPSLF